jgi:glycosyltransferase involved in cell wall biosynthesis
MEGCRMKICHIGTLPLERMGKITKDLVQYSNGENAYHLLGDTPYPQADIYVLNCFKRRYKEFRDFKRPYPGSKIISLVHSSYPCISARESDYVVTQTNYWREKLLREKGIDSRVIYSSVEVPKIKSDLNSKWFGRITRDDKGKFHPAWNRTARKILDSVEGSRMLIISCNVKKKLRHPFAFYNEDVTDENKFHALSELSVAVFAHGSFEEVFPLAVLECMAVGLPIVYLDQPSMHEMIREQYPCKNIKELKEKVIWLLRDKKNGAVQSWLARRRAEFFTIEKTMSAWNALYAEAVE